ncbi:family 10 glycosylhydrolase [candidate division KSB1 bacterium]|nr:family 10 glycosylhydrolase [candidate division KSB1 bacterium]
MKQFFLLCSILLFVQVIFGRNNQEFRATWVVTWESIDATKDTEANKANVRKILDDHVAANMNAVLWQCRQNGAAYYQSSFEPWGEHAGGKDPGYDPLAYAIEEAHKRGLEIHAWFNVFECRSLAKGTPAAEHPEWICRDQNDKPMTSTITISPGLSQVREYLAKVAMEIVRKYDIDGFHLDYVRWSEVTTLQNLNALSKSNSENRYLEWMIPEEQLEILAENTEAGYFWDIDHPNSAGIPAGFNTWADWRRWAVTEFVRVLHDSIQSVKPWVRLSPAVLGKYNWDSWQGYGTVYQDPARWYNEGYVDQLMPMHYHWTSAYEFYQMLIGGGEQSWGRYIQPGVRAGRLFTVGPGSYILDDRGAWGNHPAIIKQCRDISWVDGFQFFSYASWSSRDYWDEAGTTFFQDKAKIRPLKSVQSPPPEYPKINLTKIDSLNYQIEVIPPATTPENHWFVLYRSSDKNASVESDKIIDIHFGNSNYSIIEKFDGWQDFGDRYHYFATALNRYKVESAVSNIVQTEPIPSFAPIILATTPVNGDTIPVNSEITIWFSKKMSAASLTNSILLEPANKISQLEWLADQKTLIVKFISPFKFETQYKLTILPEAVDMNGKPLDGDADGKSGDSFQLHFFTSARDLQGPVITGVFPDSQRINNFPIDEVITILFDEIVDANSITEQSISLKQNANSIGVYYSLSTLADRSILSVQSLFPLENNSEYSLWLSGDVADTLGNKMNQELNFSFTTSPDAYSSELYIEKFLSTTNWWQPHESGSTVGIYKPNTTFGISTAAYLPNSPKRQRISAALQYQWEEPADSYFIREYLIGDAPRAVLFDSTYIMQCHVFGDGSLNKFRFCVDDSTKDLAEFHEVSNWVTIDWIGWRLIEWQMNDTSSIGRWTSEDRTLNGSLSFDSFQLTHEPGAALTGAIYFDNLRLVKKEKKPSAVQIADATIPSQMILHPNFPNPFNPATKIGFELPNSGKVQLAIFDLLGREVARIYDEVMAAGTYQVNFEATHLPSGTYFYRLQFGNEKLIRSMILIK